MPKVGTSLPSVGSVGGSGQDGSMADVTFRELCLDAADPHALAAFWAGALHRTLETDEHAAELRGADGRPDGSLTWVDPVPD